MTQTLWQRKPKRMRVTVEGRLGPHISAKDLALHVIATIGADGARGHALEYAGEAIRALSMEGRLTLCNMSIEAGARCAMVGPDEATFAWIRGRPCAPQGPALETAIATGARSRPMRARSSTGRSRWTRGEVAPLVTWGVKPGGCAARHGGRAAA